MFSVTILDHDKSHLTIPQPTLWVSLDLFGHIGFHILIVSSSFSMQDFREFFCFLLILTSNANILGFLV
ncbi:unnamed protein product [Rhizophagus irregularis]|nr:unnamed protein product [Rhizophagus irregularis]